MTEHDRIRCEEVVAHLLEYLDGELDAGDATRIERHIAECRECYSRAEFEQALRRRLRELGHERPPASLLRRLRGLLETF